MNMWKIYDELIDAIPADLQVKECQVGINWILVRSETTGMAMTVSNGLGMIRQSGTFAGMKVRELAGYIKSWNTLEAGIGLAAINSALNTKTKVEQHSGLPLEEHSRESVFELFRPELEGKRVTVIGHFPGLDNLKGWCDLSILERNPHQGDLPDPACEYILPEQDYVFTTATTLINKTFPRILELSKQAKVIMAGPSTPFYQGLFSEGVDALAGAVLESEELWTYIKEGGMGPGIFTKGCRMVCLQKN